MTNLDISVAMPPRRSQFSPAQVLAVSLFALIAAGTLLLRLPIAAERSPISLLDAFFTSTSAVCVTGLNVIDTPRDLSTFGEVVLLLLIQAGGLGYMSISTLVALALGRHLSVKERLTLQEALNVDSMEGIGRFTLRMFALTLAFELAGALVLALGWAGEMGAGKAAYFGLFHAVSAFNNAGFALFSDNLVGYRGDWVVNLTICSLIVVGGLGFVVLSELGDRRAGRRLSVHSRIVLTLTPLLIVGGAAALYLFEVGNPRTLAPLGWPERVLASLFQSVSARTAGFNTLDIGALTESSLFLLVFLMFIGAAPGGTGGGIKVTTFSIVVAALWSTVRGADEPVLFKRRIPLPLVARAFFISLIAFLAVNAVAAMVLVMEQRGLVPTLFETTSAFGTVGLSMGAAGVPYSLAGVMSASGKLLLVVMMFMGRIGPLTAAVALARRRAGADIRYAEGRILVG